MIIHSDIQLADVADLSTIHERALQAETVAKRTLVDRWTDRGRQVQIVIYTWQARIKVAGGLRVMTAWMPGQGVPNGAEALELTVRVRLAPLRPLRSLLLQPKGVG